MASDLSSGCTETIDIFDEKEEGEISLEDVSSSEEGGIGHLTCGYVIRSRRSCSNCKSSWGECASWCTASSKAYSSKGHSRKDPVKGKENRHHVNEGGCATARHTAMSTLQEKNDDDLLPISSDSDMEIVGLTDTSKQLANRPKVRLKKKKKKKDYECFTIDDLISPSSIDLTSVVEHFNESRETSSAKGTSLSSRSYYRESSPIRRSGRSRMISRSPLRRYRSPVPPEKSRDMRARSPFQSCSRSPPLQKRLSRRLKSPKRSRSPYASPVRTRKLQRLRSSSPPPARSCVDYYGDMTKQLLKKVNSVPGIHAPESSANRSKEHQPASLREKLSNMMKKTSDNAHTHYKEKSLAQPKAINDADDEEDLALLRQKALETKQKHKCNKSEHSTETEPERKPSTRTNDDQDEEDLQLRMIALRSAVMKKHQNRIRAKNKKTTTAVNSRSESPFTQSFIENISIPEDYQLKSATPSSTPPLSDSNHIEDMDLDTDVEREKEKLSYSPTNKISAAVSIDTELLGIEPSDVSFISLNDNCLNNSPTYVKNCERKPAPPFHANLPHYESSSNCFAYVPPSARDNDRVNFHVDSNDNRELPDFIKNLHDDSIECNLIDGTCCQRDIYSSINVPVYVDVESMDLPLSSTASHYASLAPTQNFTAQQSNCDGLLTHVDLASGGEQLNNIQSNEHACKTAFGYPVTSSPTASALESSPNGSMVTMVTIDYLPETDGDSNSPFIDRNPLTAVDYVPNEEALCQADETARESLYVQNVPDITKDINKIPTLINRALVPMTILKSNKQLQQPLPKRETLPKPTFKSAEMQPVIATANTKRNKTNLKPIKLIPLMKKPQTVLTTPVEFNDSVDENLENLTSESVSSHETESRLAADVPAVASNNSIPSRKKRKRVRKNREKTLNNKDSLRENSLCTKDIVNKDVNLTTIGTMITQQAQQMAECDQKKNNDDSTTRESSMENRELLNSQNITETQKFLSSIDSSDNKLQNADNINKNDQHVFSNNEESSNYTALSSSNENTQEKKIESNRNIVGRLSTNSDDTSVSNKTIQVTKDGEKEQNSNRRESVDENEDELRAILLASLVKRTTKSSDTSATSTLVTTSCVTTNTRVSARKASASATTMLIVDTTAVNNNTSLPSTLNLSEAIESMNNMAAKRTNVLISSLGSNKKKSNSETMAKGSPKKMVKKTLVPANAKVMNNTKESQSILVQQKPNNQKHDTTAYNDKTKLKQDNVWSANAPKASTKMHTLETQRIVINLGSDTDSESETERHTTDASVSNTINVNAQDINTDFEKSLHKFLRDVRKEQESAVTSKPALSPQLMKRNTPITQMDLSKAPSSNMHTPLAVRHLPASQQEEYRRLKQQILEREKLKLQRRAINNNNNKGTNSTNNSASSDNKLVINESSTSLKSLSPYDKESTTAFKQDQVKLRKTEKNNQHSWTEVRENITDMKSTMISNISHASTNKIVSTNIAKQTNSVHLQAKGAKKVVPNLNIRITAEVENRIIENSVDLASKHQPLSDKQPFRAALRTLSNDEIDRKYIQIQLKQDMTERVVTINDKSLIMQHDTMSDDRGEKSVANDSATGNNPDVKVINNRNNYNDSFSNASTIVLTNLSANSDAMKFAFADSTMQTTISNSEFEREREREINHDIPISLLLESNSHNSNDASHTSDVNANLPNDRGNTDTVWNTVRKEPKAELKSLEHLSKIEQHRHLSSMENKLVARRYTILDHLAEMSGDLRQWDMEMDLQSNLVVEVRKLKEQLKVAEKRLQAQRNRISSMNPKISTARQEINAGQRECFELSNICKVLGNWLVGKDYKLPEAGNQLLNDKLKEIANHTRQLSKKKLSSNDSSENSVLPISSSQMSSSPESPKTYVEEDLSLQKQLTNEAAAAINCMMELGSDISRSEQSNNIENSSTIDISETLPNQVTLARRNQTSAIVWESYGDGQDTPNQDNTLPSEPKLSSTPILIRRDSECTQRTRRKDTAEFAASSELRLSSPPLYEDNQQQNNKKTQLLPTATTITTMTTTMTTTATITTTMTTMTTTTTTMTATVIEPYVSILTHFKTPRNANPNGVLCPYDLMGTCNDGDCQFVHQSTSHI